MGDFNEDVRKDNMEKWRDELGLREVMLDGLGEENAPSTYDKGKSPIDSILCSANIGMVKAGYLPFGEGAGDHRPLVIDSIQTNQEHKGGGGSNKAYIQHLRYLEKENRGRRPREAFMEDLRNEVEEWRANGESIIIMVDCNEDLRK